MHPILSLFARRGLQLPRARTLLAMAAMLLLGSATWVIAAAGDGPAPAPAGMSITTTTRPAPHVAPVHRTTPATRPATRLTTAAASAMPRAATPGEADPAPSAPATQPAAAEASAAKELGQIDLIKVLKGEKPLTTEQVFQLGYWIDFVKDLVFGLLAMIPRVFCAALLYGIFWVIYRCVRRVLIGGMAKAGVDPSIRDMLSSLLKWGILGFGLVIAGNQIGIQIAALLTGVSIIGLSVGFAAQTTLANFIAGVVIFWDKPFRVGDWIEIEGVFGKVQRVTFRSTRMLNKDGEVVVFANTAMLSTKLLNHTTESLNRVTVPVTIRWSESIDDTRAMLLALLGGDRRICAAPAPAVVVEGLGEANVNLALHFWVADESAVFDIRYEYLEKTKKALDAARAPKAPAAPTRPDAPTLVTPAAAA
jgi:small conductance mechanosensitive channel